MELAQLLLVSVVSILTLLLVVVGIHALLILRDFRKSVKKLNNILEDAQSVSSSIATPLAGSKNIFESFRQVKDMVNYVAKRPDSGKSTTGSTGSTRKTKDNTEKIIHAIKVNEEETFKTPTRVFKRNGRPLTS